MSKFHSSLTGKIKKNHIFSCSLEDETERQIIMKLRKSDRECDAAIPHYAVKRGFEGRSLFENLPDAVSNRANVMKAQHIDKLIPPGINPYKKVEMHNKYHVFIPQIHWDDVLYEAPTEKELQIVKEEKKEKSAVRKNKKGKSWMKSI